MTSSPHGRQTMATVAKVVFVLALVVGVALAMVAGWGVLEVRDQRTGEGPDTALVDNQGVATITEGFERTILVDGPSLKTAECTVTAPDGTTRTIEGFDPVGSDPRLGTQSIGDYRAEVGGDHQVRCTGVEESWVSDEFDPQSRSLLAIPALAGAFLVVAVLPVAVISLVVWRLARGR